MTTKEATLTQRIHNFSAGPAVLPVPVLEQVRDELLNWRGSGMSVMEMSHRSAHFESILQDAEDSLRRLFGISADYKILFLQGGATLQFAMLPMNLRPAGASADYLLTGAWAKAALKEAEKSGAARAAGSSEKDNFNHVLAQADLRLDPKAAYLHFTSNETIHGIEWAADAEPEPPAGVPLVCDASSNIASRPLDIAKYGLIYAGRRRTSARRASPSSSSGRICWRAPRPSCPSCWTTNCKRSIARSTTPRPRLPSTF
jgi:phosphoserine aminotransferase